MTTYPVMLDVPREVIAYVSRLLRAERAARELDPDTRTYNRLPRALRRLGERGFALLTQRWTALQHVMLSPRRIGKIARAALVLTQFEHRIIT